MNSVFAQSRKARGAKQLYFYPSALICILLSVLAACSSGPQAMRLSNQQSAALVSGAAGASNARVGTSKTFTSTRYGVRIDYPANLKLRRTFKHSYLQNGGWKTYLGPNSPPGKPLVALFLPGSNSITAGELRIGASRNPDAVRTCTDLPAAAQPDTKGQTIISGVTFTTFKARDAGMSHYLITRSYRAVHRGICYAMDVLVFGTNPEVYEPPAIPPFTKGQVFARLIPVARKLRFIDELGHAVASSPIAPPVTYQGLLPCADCPGIVYQLNLLADHQYHLRLDYQDRHAQFNENGRWHLSKDSKVLILQEQEARSSIQQWAVLNDGQGLRMLDRTGHPIRSGLNYDLTRSRQFEPLAAEEN